MTARRARGRVRRLDAGAALPLLLVLGAAVAMAAPGGAGRGHGHGPPPPAPSATPVTPSPSAPTNAGGVAGRVTVSPLAIVLELSQRAARAGQPVQVRATLTNVGPTAIGSLVVEIRANPAELLFRPSDRRSVGKVPAGAKETVTWIACGRQPASYSLVATATIDAVAVTSAPAVLRITSAGSC